MLAVLAAAVLELGCAAETGGAGMPGTCGDGLLGDGGACDDGNGVAGDGCSTACAIEEGWACEGEPSSCRCLRGLVASSETCGDLFAPAAAAQVSANPETLFPSNGDLWFSTQADDGSVFVSWGDGFGPDPSLPAPSQPYSHHGLMRLDGTWPNVTPTVVQRFMPLSDEAAGHNSKPSSLLYVDGVLYAAVHTPLLHPEVGFVAFSTDGGASFHGLYENEADLANSAWRRDRGSAFVCGVFLAMGQAYSDNVDGFVYRFGIGSEIEWCTDAPTCASPKPVYLARAPVADVLRYTVADHGWSYYAGLDALGQPRFEAEESAAAPLEVSTAQIFSATHHAGLDRYFILTATFSRGELWEAPRPWGPWRKVSTWFQGPTSPWATSYMPGILPVGVGPTSFSFAVTGRDPAYVGTPQSGGPEDAWYAFRVGVMDVQVGP